MGDLFSVQHGDGVAVTDANYAAVQLGSNPGAAAKQGDQTANARTTVFGVGFMDEVSGAVSGLPVAGIN